MKGQSLEPIFKHIFWNLTKPEIDLVNVLLNIVERKDDLDSDEFDYNQFSYIIDTNMHELSSSLGFLQLEVDTITQTLDSLTRNLATIYHEKDNHIFMTKSSFIYQFNITSTDKDINKRLNMMVSTKLIKILKDHKDLFELLYRFERFGVKSKYSKVIYERYYKAGDTAEEFTIDELIETTDFSLEKKTKMDWSRVNSNILKRVSDELSKKTDMYFQFQKVKTAVGDTKRIQTTGIKLFITMAPEVNDPEVCYSDRMLMDRKVAYYIERDIKHRFAALNKFKTKEIISDPEAYMYKMRTDAQKIANEYEAQVLLQEWLNNIKYNNHDHEGLVVLEDYSKDNQFITINNNYKLYDIEKKQEISTSARDSRIKIKAFMKDGHYDIVETEDYIKNCSISYTSG